MCRAKKKKSTRATHISSSLSLSSSLARAFSREGKVRVLSCSFDVNGKTRPKINTWRWKEIQRPPFFLLSDETNQFHVRSISFQSAEKANKRRNKSIDSLSFFFNLRWHVTNHCPSHSRNFPVPSNSFDSQQDSWNWSDSGRWVFPDKIIARCDESVRWIDVNRRCQSTLFLSFTAKTKKKMCLISTKKLTEPFFFALHRLVFIRFIRTISKLSNKKFAFAVDEPKEILVEQSPLIWLTRGMKANDRISRCHSKTFGRMKFSHCSIVEIDPPLSMMFETN